MIGLTPDKYAEFLKEWFGKNWIYVLRPLIEEVPLFLDNAESQKTMRDLWCVAMSERERRYPRKRRLVVAANKRLQAEPVEPAPAKQARGPILWIDRTVKDD